MESIRSARHYKLGDMSDKGARKVDGTLRLSIKIREATGDESVSFISTVILSHHIFRVQNIAYPVPGHDMTVLPPAIKISSTAKFRLHFNSHIASRQALNL